MLPRYRRLVEQLAQSGLLVVICGTDTLGVGINVPIRTVLFTGLAKFDGTRQRILRAREFMQIAGRAGRAGFDTAGYVVVQAPEHAIDNAKALAKFADDPKKQKSVRRKKPPEGEVVWTEETFLKLVARPPEQLVSRMKVDNAMLVNVVARAGDAFPVMRRLMWENHEERKKQLRLSRQALRLARSLVHSGVLTRLDEPDGYGRRYVLTVDLPPAFALNQPLAHFALAALDVLDPEDPEHTLNIVSVVESVLEAPRQVLFAQQNAAKGEAVAEMKADGIEYEERMQLLDSITWPRPLAELLEVAFEIYRQTHPWLPVEALGPKSVVREMYEQGMSFTDFVSRYQLSRSEGLLLRYLTDAYRTFRHTVPDTHRTLELDDLIEWLGETVRQTDSSLLDEWEALTDPEHAQDHRQAPAPPRLLSQQDRVLQVMVRNAMFRRVALAARDDVDGLAALERSASELVEPTGEVLMTRARWDEALESYYAEHDSIATDADARGPDLIQVSREGRSWQVRQTIHDPAGDHDWVIEATVDLDATDEVGEPVVTTTTMRRL
jgi:hypothetical protein